MKTVEQKLIEMCVDNGMFESQAKQVIDLAKPELEESGHITWDKPSDEYPLAMYAVMFMSVKRVAVKWIDENLPNAWYRNLFVE